MMPAKCHSTNSSACTEISEQGPVSKKYFLPHVATRLVNDMTGRQLHGSNSYSYKVS